MRVACWVLSSLYSIAAFNKPTAAEVSKFNLSGWSDSSWFTAAAHQASWASWVDSTWGSDLGTHLNDTWPWDECALSSSGSPEFKTELGSELLSHTLGHALWRTCRGDFSVAGDLIHWALDSDYCDDLYPPSPPTPTPPPPTPSPTPAWVTTVFEQSDFIFNGREYEWGPALSFVFPDGTFLSQRPPSDFVYRYRNRNTGFNINDTSYPKFTAAQKTFFFGPFLDFVVPIYLEKETEEFDAVPISKENSSLVTDIEIEKIVFSNLEFPDFVVYNGTLRTGDEESAYYLVLPRVIADMDWQIAPNRGSISVYGPQTNFSEIFTEGKWANPNPSYFLPFESITFTDANVLDPSGKLFNSTLEITEEELYSNLTVYNRVNYDVDENPWGGFLALFPVFARQGENWIQIKFGYLNFHYKMPSGVIWHNASFTGPDYEGFEILPSFYKKIAEVKCAYPSIASGGKDSSGSNIGLYNLPFGIDASSVFFIDFWERHSSAHGVRFKILFRIPLVKKAH